MLNDRPQSLTELAHRTIANVVQFGDLVVDATAGNGHDTLFLANLTGPTGRVLAVDIQLAAVNITRRRMADNKQMHVVVQQQSHADTIALADETVTAMMFNLGYQPGGDKAIVTQPANTTAALDQAAQLLKPGGVITVIAYRGHPGGQPEERAVHRWSEALDDNEYRKTRTASDANNQSSPVLFVVHKLQRPRLIGRDSVE
jgi:predicted methyltransferase